jgi:CHAT domain-containing protein
MRIRDLAAGLIAAKTDSQRRKLIKENPRLADVRLAREIKDLCYAKWAGEPAAARKAAAALSVLQKIAPAPETEALSWWIRGIARITKSDFAGAVESLTSAADAFELFGNRTDAAQTNVAKLIALALLGRYKEADRTGQRSLKVFERVGDQLAAGKIEMNLSNVAARRERHRDAERYALSALKRFRSLGEKQWQTMAENDLANTYSELNDFRKAERFFGLAAASARAAKMRLTEAEIEASMGNLELFRGRYGDALRLLEQSRQKYDELEMPHQKAIAELEIAEIYAELNLIAESISMLVPVTDRLRKLKLRAEEARARFLLARSLAKNADPAASAKHLQRARLLFAREDNVIGVARTDLLRAEIEIALGKYASAASIAAAARKLLKDGGTKRLHIWAEFLEAESLALQDDPNAAEYLDRAVKAAENAQQLSIAAAALNSLGHVHARAGNTAAARSAFRRAVSIVERMRSPIASDEFRTSFLAGNLGPYVELFKIAIRENTLGEALKIHESSRARSMSEAMASDNSRALNRDLSGEMGRVREELNWFYSRLNRDAAADVKTIEKEIESRERQITVLSRRMDALSKAASRSRAAFDIDRLQKSLGNRSVIIEYVIVDGSVSAFVVTGSSLEYFQDMCRENDIRPIIEGLQFQFGTLRFGSGALEQFLPQLKRSTDEYLNRMYKLLLHPLTAALKDRKLVIIPSRVLNYIPFNALFDGERYLVERCEISLAPSAEIWLSLARRSRRRMGTQLLMGYSDESIPQAETEIRNIRKIFQNAQVFTAKRATLNAFTEHAPGADIIHLACHGRFRSDNPMFSSLHLADGWITVRDLSRQKLRAGLVTLSACETGLSEVRPGEELLGLTRGFLLAGVQSLIMSLWTVSDEATSRLMKDLYNELHLGCTSAASLRAAQRLSIRRAAHPYYWAPFVHVGP